MLDRFPLPLVCIGSGAFLPAFPLIFSASLPFTFVMYACFLLWQQVSSLEYSKQLKVFMACKRNPMALQIQEQFTFVDFVSQFCLRKIQILLHVFCSLNVSIFHIRIKFLTDLLPWRTKHQNLTVTERNKRRSRLQTDSSVTNVQFK